MEIHTRDEVPVDPMTGEPHVCKTWDGVVIRLGLRVIDYDNKLGTVVESPSSYDYHDIMCWPTVGNNGHWWGVCADAEGHTHKVGECRGRIFDGSRLTTRGVAAREVVGS